MIVDTLKISKRLEDASLSKEAAEAIAESIAEVTTLDLATKADLANLELRLTEKINAVRDPVDSVRDRIDAVRDRVGTILWAVVGVGVLTWVLQIFGNIIKHLLGMP